VRITDKVWTKLHKEMMNDLDVRTFYDHPAMQQAINNIGKEIDFFSLAKHLLCFENIIENIPESEMLVAAGERTPYGKYHRITQNYIYQACLILDKMGSLENKNVFELGGAFGGLARALTLASRPKRYIIADQLPMTYLANHLCFNLPAVTCIESQRIAEDATEYDLFISNFCLTELPIEFREMVYKELFPRCKAFFVIDTSIDTEGHNTEIEKMIGSTCNVEPYQPYLDKKDIIVRWGGRE
jgi:hypothetical protein